MQRTNVATYTLSPIVISVPDVATLDRCKAWYEALGLPKMDFDEPGESYWFDAGNSVLLGIHTEPGASPAGVTLYLNVADVDEAHGRLQAQGFAFESGPETRFWGRYVRLRDPAGTSIRLVTPAA